MHNEIAQLQIGHGIYTVSEISKLLRISSQKVRSWLKKYWDGKFNQDNDHTYSWSIDKSKAVDFYTLIEIYSFMLLGEAGVRTTKIVTAHEELSRIFKTPYPLAKQDILESIRTDGQKVYFEQEDNIVALDGTRQLNLTFIQEFINCLEFDKELMASRFWPLGKSNSVVVDPHRQMGHPVVGNTNIYPEVIHGMFKSGDSIEFLAFNFQLSQKQIRDAISYCQAA